MSKANNVAACTVRAIIIETLSARVCHTWRQLLLTAVCESILLLSEEDSDFLDVSGIPMTKVCAINI